MSPPLFSCIKLLSPSLFRWSVESGNDRGTLFLTRILPISMKRTRRQVLMAVGGMATGTFALQEYARRKEPTDYPTDTDSEAEAKSEEPTTRAHEREEAETETESESRSEAKPETRAEASVEILEAETRAFEPERRDGKVVSVGSVRVSVENTGEVPVAPSAEAESHHTEPDSSHALVTRVGTLGFETLEPGQRREATIHREEEGVIQPWGSALLIVKLLSDGEEVSRDEKVVEA